MKSLDEELLDLLICNNCGKQHELVRCEICEAPVDYPPCISGKRCPRHKEFIGGKKGGK